METKGGVIYKLSDLCEALGVPPHRVAYLYDKKLLPEPQRLGRWRIFLERDVTVIREMLGAIEGRGLGRPRKGFGAAAG